MGNIKKPSTGYNMQSLNLDERRLALLKKIAKEQDRSVTGQIRRIVKNYLDNIYPAK